MLHYCNDEVVDPKRVVLERSIENEGISYEGRKEDKELVGSPEVSRYAVVYPVDSVVV